MKYANPTAIGAFVAGAITIAIGAVIFFGSGALNTGNQEFVCLFRENVDGLQRGAKVTFKGVPVGTVKEILVRFESSTAAPGDPLTSVPSNLPLIPVIFEVDSSRITDTMGSQLARSPDFHKQQVQQGLRGQLVSTSLITGLLQVDLDYYPEAEPSDQTLSIELDDSSYFVIPVIPSEFTHLKEQAFKAIDKIASIDFQKIGTDLATLMDNLNGTVEEFDVESLNKSIASVRDALSSEELDATLTAFRDTAKNISLATERLTAKVEAWPVEELLGNASSAVNSLEATLANIDTMVEKTSPTRQELDRTLTEFADAAKEIEELAAYLKQHPNSIIFGRKDEKEPDDSPTSISQPRPPRFNRPGR